MEPGVELSIIIPAYNEARRIGQTLETLRQYVEQQGWKVEMLVVNDGSTDNTCRIVSEYAASWPVLQLIENRGNRGKGYGVQNGVRHATGRIVLFTDADLSAPPEEMPKILDPIRADLVDVTFGSRAIDRSLIGVHQSPFREFSGIVFNFFVQFLTGLRYQDTQCGFKAFRRDEILPVFERQKILGFGFDPEILYIAKKRGLRLREVPVRWNHVEGTTVRFFKDSLQMFLDLLHIRWNDWRGKYD
jgi:glycosyltransferase involved in cell wall biosynthesis